MRKLSLLCLLSILLLNGCMSAKKDEHESIKNYESFITAVLNNKGIESKVIPFDYKLHVNKQNDNSYQYEVVISNPRVAMYNIQAIAVDPTVDSNKNLYPCIGLLGDDTKKSFQMIPFQSNGELNFVEKIGLDGVAFQNQFTLQVMVTWKDSSLVNTQRVFFNTHYVEEEDDTATGIKKTAEKKKQ